jgi:hypothetical protein
MNPFESGDPLPILLGDASHHSMLQGLCPSDLFLPKGSKLRLVVNCASYSVSHKLR